ncbi:hypothetical protein KCU67_g1291, partial [Aureobasidium melanogenum]
MAPKAAISVRAKATDKPIKIRFGTFKGKDYMANGQIYAMQEKAMTACTEARVLVLNILELRRVTRLEKTLPIPADATIDAVEDDRKTIARTLGEVNKLLRLRESNLESLIQLRDDILGPFYAMAQNPDNFPKTHIGKAIVQQTREAAWRFLLGTMKWQDAGENFFLGQYNIKLNQALNKTIKVDWHDLQPYEGILQGIMSQGEVFDVEELWDAAKKAFKEFFVSNKSSARKVDELEGKMKSLEDEKSSLEEELDSAKEQATSANTEAEVDLTQVTRLVQLETEVQELQSRVNEFEEEKDKLDEEVTSLKTRLTSKNATIKRLKENIQILEGAPLSAADIADHPAYKEALAEIENLWFGTLGVTEDAMQIEDRAREYKNKNKKLEAQVARLERQNGNLQTDCEAFKEEYDLASKASDDLLEQNRALASEVAQLRDTEKVQQSTINNLTTEYEGALKKEEEVKDELSALDKTYQEAVGRSKTLADEYHNLQQDYERVLEAQTCMNILARALPTPSSGSTQTEQSAESSTTQPEQSAAGPSSSLNTGAPGTSGDTPQDTEPSFDNNVTMQRLLELVSDSKNLPLDKSINDLMQRVEGQATTADQHAARLTSALGNQAATAEQHAAQLTSALGNQAATAEQHAAQLASALETQAATAEQHATQLASALETQAATAEQHATQLTSALETQEGSSRTRHEELLKLLKKETEDTLQKIQTTDGSVQSLKDEGMKKFETIINLLQEETDAAKKRSDEVTNALNAQNEATKKRLEDQIKNLSDLTVQIETAHNNEQRHANELKEVQSAKDDAVKAREAAVIELNNIKLEKATLQTDLEQEKNNVESRNKDLAQARSRIEALDQQLDKLRKDLEDQRKQHQEDTASLQADSANLRECRETHQTMTTKLTRVQGELLDVKANISTAEQSERAAMTKLQEQNTKVAQLIDQNTAAETAKKHYEDLSKKVQDTQTSLENVRRKLEEEATKYRTLHGQLAEEKEDLDRQKQSAAGTQGALTERANFIENQKTSYKSDKEKFDKERSSQEARINSLEEQIKSLNLQIEQAQKREDDLRSRKSDQDSEITQKAKQIIRLEHDIEKARLERIHQELAVEHAKINQGSAVRRQLELENRVADLVGELAAENATRRAHEVTITKLTREADSYRLNAMQINSGFASIRADQNQINDLNQKIGRLQAEIERLKPELEGSKAAEKEKGKLLDAARQAELDSKNKLSEANQRHTQQTTKLESDISIYKERVVEMQLTRNAASEEAENAKKAANLLQSEVKSLKTEKAKLDEDVKKYKFGSEIFVKHIQLLLFDQGVPAADFNKAMLILPLTLLREGIVATVFPLEESLGLETPAQKSTEWVLSIRNYEQTNPYLAMSIDQLLIHFFSVTWVQSLHPNVQSMLEALLTKATMSEIMLERAVKLEKFLYHLFTLPQQEHLSLIEIRLIEVIVLCATRAGHGWAHLEHASKSWATRVNRLPEGNSLLFRAYGHWLGSLVAQQVATLPNLLCSLTLPEQKVTERATGRIMLGSINGPSVHAVVDLTTQQIAVFGAKDEGVDYPLPSRLLELPERRLRNASFGTANDFRMPPVRFLTDYGRDILELTRKSTTSSS